MKKLILFLSITLTLSTFAQVPNYVPTNGLVGWWPFNGNANDESGNGNNGTVNGATLTTDRFGNANSAYDFDGIDDLISLVANFDEPQRTISTWFSLDAYSSIRQCILNNDYPELTNGHTIFLINGDDSLKMQSGSPNATSIPASINEWYFLCMTRGDSTRHYVNGVLILTHANGVINSTNADSQNLRVGVNRSANLYFNGKIDDIGIWNRALTSCEIADLYNAQLGSLNTTSATTVANCENYTWNNQTYTSSGQYTEVLTNVVGCDSTVTLDLTITQPTTGSETNTECNSFTWGANNQTYSQSGQYTEVLTNVVGCDSTVTLDLTITQPTTGSETITECSLFTWGANNQTYTSSGQYTAVLTNAVGCDSTVTLDLTINSVDNGITQVDDFTLQANATGALYQWIDCADESAVFGATNQQFAPAENGDYAVIVTQNGCSDTTECLSVSRLSILEHEQTLLVVYPNPATSMITIENPQGIASNYVVIDAQGRQVHAGKLQGETTSIDVAHIANGMYTITFEKNNLKDIKFIKK